MKTLLVRILIMAALALWAAAGNAATTEFVIRAAKGQFEEVKERAMLAIENRGLVLNYTARVGDMLARTGKDIGRGHEVYLKAEVLEFCSARLSRDTMEADPRNIVFCPYAIAIYVLPQDPGKVYVGHRKLAASGAGRSLKALRAVEKLLDDIAREALR
jgi:uncharacterized protein (DUF302 family)